MDPEKIKKVKVILAALEIWPMYKGNRFDRLFMQVNAAFGDVTRDELETLLKAPLCELFPETRWWGDVGKQV